MFFHFLVHLWPSCRWVFCWQTDPWVDWSVWYTLCVLVVEHRENRRLQVTSTESSSFCSWSVAHVMKTMTRSKEKSLMLNLCAGWMFAVGTWTARRRSVRTARTEPTCRSALGPTAGAGLRTPSSCWPGYSTSISPSQASVCSSLCCPLTGSPQATSYPSAECAQKRSEASRMKLKYLEKRFA